MIELFCSLLVWFGAEVAPQLGFEVPVAPATTHATPADTIDNDWGRDWFIDQPTRMTPERIHGGID